MNESADGSDAGLAITTESGINKEVMVWGSRAKKEVLCKEEAYITAINAGIYLEGLTGTKDGIIGALAATGLRKAGNDGRCIWLRGKELRELKGTYTIKDLMQVINANAIVDEGNQDVAKVDKMDVGDWLRPVLIDNKITIVVQKEIENAEYDWKTASKEYIKSISD